MTTCNVLKGQSAADRLALLGIKPVWLQNALLAGDAEARTSTPLDPLITAGIYRYSRIVRVFREQTVNEENWTFDNRRNQPRTISPTREFAVIVAQGNEFTGDADAVPSNKYGKGVTVADAVVQNEQLALDLESLLPDGVELEPGETVTVNDGLTTWVLLYTAVDNEIRYELSQPNTMTGGFITGWSERILFASLALDATVLVEEPADEYDVPVERRDRPA